MADDQVIVEPIGNDTAVLTLNRPDKLNALNEGLMQDIIRSIEDANGDYKVLIIEGSGKSFSAGADLDEVQEGKELFPYFTELAKSALSFRGIIIGKHEGYTVGGGLEFALSFDLRYSTPEGKFMLTESKIDATIGAGSSALLPNIVGGSKARELIYTAKEINAEEACQIGLINDVFDKDQIDAKVESIATDLVSNKSYDALARNKMALNHALQLQTVFDYEEALGISDQKDENVRWES